MRRIGLEYLRSNRCKRPGRFEPRGAEGAEQILHLDINFIIQRHSGRRLCLGKSYVAGRIIFRRQFANL